MKSKNLITITTAAILLSVASSSALAGKGGGGKGGGGGGSGFDTPVEFQLAIGFRDNENDGVQSDGGIYFDGDIGLTGEDPLLDAHIDASAGKNYGNLYLRTGDTTNRSIYLDNSQCLSADCMELAEALGDVALTVAATEALGAGFCGMTINQTITAPMQITYFKPGVENPGFVHYQPGFKGKSPCRGDNGSSEVTVVRIAGDQWTVSGNAACVTAPYGDPGGLANMPFEFYVTNMSDENCR